MNSATSNLVNFVLIIVFAKFVCFSLFARGPAFVNPFPALGAGTLSPGAAAFPFVRSIAASTGIGRFSK